MGHVQNRFMRAGARQPALVRTCLTFSVPAANLHGVAHVSKQSFHHCREFRNSLRPLGCRCCPQGGVRWARRLI
jgi:hypothetical protein